MAKDIFKEALEAVKKYGNRTAAAEALGVHDVTFRGRVRRAKTLYPELYAEIDDEKFILRKGTALDERLLREAAYAYARHGNNATDAAYALGLSPTGFRNRLRRAQDRLGLTAETPGRTKSTEATKLKLPAKGKVKRYILTCAQNNTKVEPLVWSSLKALATHYEAEIKISTFTYVKRQHGSAKRGAAANDTDVWYDPAIEPFLSDRYEELAPGLQWCGHMNTLPTTKDPLAGWETYTGRASGIFPHVKIAMQSVPSHAKDATKFNYTTGTVTKRNYLEKAAGLKADFHHAYGGLLVEVDSSGTWFVRQLNADTKGDIYDLNIVVRSDGSVGESNPLAIVWGDIHVANLDPSVKKIAWGENGMLDNLKPSYQFMHDLLDFQARNHHTIHNPHERFRLLHSGKGNVLDEVLDVGKFLKHSKREGCQTVVVNSNHDNHFERWLREADWRSDPENAELFLQAQSAILAAIKNKKEFNPMKWVLEHHSKIPEGVRFLKQDESFVLCKDRSGGIEMGLHGDLGPNGSRGSYRNLAKMGRKACVGHSHSAGIYEGVYTAGVSGVLQMRYNKGPSSWSHSHVIVHPNGKRQVITMWKGKWRL